MDSSPSLDGLTQLTQPFQWIDQIVSIEWRIGAIGRVIGLETKSGRILPLN